LRAKKRSAQRRVGKVARHPNTVLIWELREQMDAEGKAGLCIYCEERLPPMRTLICPTPECELLYNNDWRRAQRMLQRQAEKERQAA
jgi:hypothetical protein